MRKILFLFALLPLLILASCGEKEVALPTWTGGAEMTLSKSTSLADVVASAEAFVDKQLLLEGTVVGVCKGSGCWVQLDDGKGNKFYCKSMDHSIAFPKDCEGKTARVQGTMLAQPSSGHSECAHGEDEGHEGHEDHAGEEAHTCPSPTYLVNIEGAVLL
ncbi:MAG: DUF4920 domain-containing protein [Candidatus Krumholzibacteria bacterium]|nr:DUF4920 domain-containing protein [Candidatus Krumholzibacteria bacterium]MDP6797740.1 DUF4920 domain-containing protein [Candidatus Krumholzibacteria bacterium]MDP7022234.1 DUF4920 domain-containing protein [Candidatus Krumholzibacteria bacterium]